MTFEEYAQKHLGTAGLSFEGIEMVRMGWNARGSYGSCPEIPDSSACEVSITPEMIEAGAQRLVAWEDGSEWPDSWSPMVVAVARNDAERVLRSALNAQERPEYNVDREFLVQLLTDRQKRIDELEKQVAESASLPPFDPNKPRDEQGLYGKFLVRRVDGSDLPGGKHHGCKYFVLDVDHDKYATAALGTYASQCEQEYPLLAKDLREKFGAQGGQGAEPVAWMNPSNPREVISDIKKHAMQRSYNIGVGQSAERYSAPLYTHPQPTQQGSVPEGCQHQNTYKTGLGYIVCYECQKTWHPDDELPSHLQHMRSSRG